MRITVEESGISTAKKLCQSAPGPMDEHSRRLRGAASLGRYGLFAL